MITAIEDMGYEFTKTKSKFGQVGILYFLLRKVAHINNNKNKYINSTYSKPCL